MRVRNEIFPIIQNLHCPSPTKVLRFLKTYFVWGERALSKSLLCHVENFECTGWVQIQNLQRANYAFNMLIDANFQFRRVKVTFLPMKTKDFSLLFFFSHLNISSACTCSRCKHFVQLINQCLITCLTSICTAYRVHVYMYFRSQNLRKTVLYVIQYTKTKQVLVTSKS